ncbi:MAG: methyltransferase domain-containing protein [Candidatus Hydrogenedentes bacterium]|nr:methyltransferase domain-containing protein [Candidatus Hydrogenedentota bacterium]
MEPRTFESFRKLVYERSGIALGDQKEALVSARVGKRIRALGLADPADYLAYVKADKSGQEVVQLIDAISTNVTSFFREPDHFDFLRQVMTQWAEEGQRRFRLWSAASSTGEEPYSIAMTLLESVDARTTDVKLLATDISTRVLEKCLVGQYDKEKMKTVIPSLLDRYFDRVPGVAPPRYSAKRCLRDLIVFKRLNLSSHPFPMSGPLDVVFCRNVMIYFDNDLRNKLLAEVYRLLKPGGYLMVGHAESLTGIKSQFRTVRPSVYIK